MSVECTMKIACTAKARELLKSSPFEDIAASKSPDFFSWHAHVYLHKRQKILLLINDLTGFPVVLYRPLVAQLKDFASVAIEAIREAFLEYGVKPKHVDRYFEMAGQVELTGKTSRSVLSRLTEWKVVLTSTLDQCAYPPFVNNRLSQPTFSRKVFPVSWTHYEHPTDLLTNAFADALKVDEDELYDVESFELTIRLMLKNHPVTRKVLLPANATLDNLHRVIQSVFGWADTHQHQFLVIPKDATSIYVPTPIDIYNAENLNDPDFYDPTKPFLMDATTTIKDVMELPYDLWYEYDFGDSWVHKITLEGSQHLKGRYYRLLECEGQCPPDDVGGEAGYEAFLEVMSDESHPNHQELCHWYKFQIQHRMPLSRINAWLGGSWLI